MKADNIPMGSMKRKMTSPNGSTTPFFAPPSSFLIGLIAPVVLTAYATTNSAATVSMPTLLKPKRRGGICLLCHPTLLDRTATRCDGTIFSNVQMNMIPQHIHVGKNNTNAKTQMNCFR